MKPSAPLLPNGKVTRVRLRNGAVVLVQEDHTVPVASLNLWIEAGSIDEKPDERGMAHLIEHMIFKGTPQRGVGEISRQVEAAGGYLNAFTSFEHTCFYTVLPSDRLETALEVEFDAYLNASFDEGELAKEKEVVFEEMRMRRDDPWSWSWELFFRTAFQKNPYHWPVIGDKAILKAVPRSKLLGYYRAHYVPRNTVVSVVGDVKTGAVLKWIQKHFEPTRRPAPPVRKVSGDAAPQRTKCRLEAGPVRQTYATLGFPTVPIGHPDAAPLEILESILGDGASSRLNLSLLENKRLAEEVGSDHFAGKYGGSWVVQGLTDKKRLDSFLKESMGEVRKVIDSGVRPEELEKVRAKIKSSKVFEKQSADGRAKILGYWQLQGDYRMEEAFLDSLDKVTSEDLSRVAEEYLKPSSASLVVYHPPHEKFTQPGSRWQDILEEGFKGEVSRKRILSKPALGVRKINLSGGGELWLKERTNLPLVSLGVCFKGGFVDEPPSLQGITSLMAKSLLKGTTAKNNEEFSKAVEGLAAHLDILVEKDYWGLTLDVTMPRFKEAFALMTEALLSPAFLKEEVEKEKELQRASIQRLEDDPADYAMLQSDLLTFAGTPYGHPPLGTLKTLSSLTADKVKDWYQKGIRAGNPVWVAVGKLEEGELAGFLEGKLRFGTSPEPPEPSRNGSSRKGVKNFKKSLKTQQAHMVLGFEAPKFGGQDYYVFRVLNTLLNGMGGRLFVELREKQSLAYSVYSSHDAPASAGICQIYIGCAPGKTQQAKDGLERVLENLLDHPVSEEELNRAKTYLVGLYQMGRQTNRAQALSYAKYRLAGPGAPLVENFPEFIRKVTAEEIRIMARKCFQKPFRTWVVLKPKRSSD